MQITRLNNRMNVVFLENPHTAMSTMAISVHVGSDDERHDFGISHFTEHMLFTGTKKRSALHIVSDIESIGGYINGGTDEKMTMYHAQVPNGNEAIMVDVLTDMILNPTFKEKDIKKEKSVISSEISNEIDDPFSRSYTSMYKMLVNKPPVIGTKENIKKMTRGKIIDYYNDWYSPNNMTCFVAGNESLIDMIEQKFSNIPARKQPTRQKLAATLPDKDYHYSIPDGEVYVTMAVPTVVYHGSDPIALDLVGSVLDRPMSGRLNIATRINKGLVYRIALGNKTCRTYGIFSIIYSTSKNNLKECKKAIYNAIFNCDIIEKPEIQSSKNFIYGKLTRIKENPNALISMASFWDSLGDITMTDKYAGMIKKMDIKDIKRIKKRYLEGKWFESIVG